MFRKLQKNHYPVDNAIHLSYNRALIYCACIRSILEYASPVFHYSSAIYLSNKIERVQKRFLRRIYADLSYDDAIKVSELATLFDRRSAACHKLFEEAQQKDHKFHSLIPQEKVCKYPVRRCTKFSLPRIRTDRYKNSFIIANSLQQ